MPLVEISGKKWFHEENSQWPGVAITLEVEEVLEDVQSKYQHVQVFKSTSFGNVLVLDGVIQYTERDECAYQETLSHTPLFGHPNPEAVLIVGGGDGGVLREVCKHASVKDIVMCEIDQVVMDFGRKYFPDTVPAWSDPRLTLICSDANEFIKDPANKERFDVVISDTSDPVGPAAALFEMPFYTALHDAMRPGGRLSTQAESMWLHQDIIKNLVTNASRIFENVQYATLQIPTYPCGQIGALQCGKKGAEPVSAEAFRLSRPVPSDFKIRYYSQKMHAASFVLPVFMEKILSDEL